MRRLATVAALLLAAVALLLPAVHADRAYTLCDPARSTLCAGLVALYEFNETATDSVRTSETGSAPLLEISRVNTGVTSSGKLGYALNHTATGSDGLFISRTAPFTGTFSAGFWLYINTAPSANGKVVPILWMAPLAASTESVPAAYLGTTGWAQPVVYLYNSSGSTYIYYEVKQDITETNSSAMASTALSTSTWYYIAFGQYPTPDSSYPARQTIWINASTTSMATRATATINYPDFGKVGHFMVAGMSTTGGNFEYGAFRLDQLGIWSRYLTDAELGSLINSGSGRAYPFY